MVFLIDNRITNNTRGMCSSKTTQPDLYLKTFCGLAGCLFLTDSRITNNTRGMNSSNNNTTWPVLTDILWSGRLSLPDWQQNNKQHQRDELLKQQHNLYLQTFCGVAGCLFLTDSRIINNNRGMSSSNSNTTWPTLTDILWSGRLSLPDWQHNNKKH